MIAEISETDASGAIAACYADIRHHLGVPVVNLVWRHLAAIGEIEPCWARARKHFAEIEKDAAALNSAARRLVAKLPSSASLPWVEPGPAILASYERGNSLNLATVRLLLGFAVPDSEGGLPQAPGGLPPVPRFSDLSPGCRQAVETLAAAGPGSDTGVRPTLWVHLAYVPDVLMAAAETLPTVLQSATFREAHGQLTEPGSSTRRANLTEEAIVALSRFNRRIGEMLLVGVYLDRSRQPIAEAIQ